MNHRSASHRTVILAVLLIWLLVGGGLGWATWAAVELERHRAEDERERAAQNLKRSHTDTLALVRAHLDSIVDALLIHERQRPFVHYRAFYKQVIYDEPLPEAKAVELSYLESPLRTMQLPEWQLLNFQASWSEGYSSPQVALAEDIATSAIAIPAVERPRQAKPANWLAALRERFEPQELQQFYEEAQLAELDRSQVISGLTSEPLPAEEDLAPAPGEQVRDGLSPNAAEFARRGERLLQLQRRYFPDEQCVSESVVLENLQVTNEVGTPPVPGTECVNVLPLPMLPTWLELTLDGERQLALIRSVSAEGFHFCTLQGVLIDWSRFKRVLEEEIRGLLPGATIELVAVRTPWEPDMLRYVPARLVTPPPALAVVVSPPTRLRWGLALTWSVTVLALVAITYGAMKYVTLADRRMRFAAAVTHELRTPLTSFQIYTDLLADLAGADDTRRRQYIETLRKESKRLARLVENVLAYSRIGDTRAALNPEPIEPQQLLESVATETAEQCRASGKRLIVENHCRGDVRVQTDREFVLQILANLVENACKHSADAADARIWLTAQVAPGEGVLFEVEDCGAGVHPGDRRAVFEPFRQGTKSGGSRTSGLGLGLALSRHWASCLGGRLVLKRGDRNGAQFSRFALSLPVR